MDNNWKFFLGDLPPQKITDGWGGAKARAYSFGATSEDFDDSEWRTIDVPHDFVIEGDYTKKKTQGVDMQKIPEMESMDSRHFAGGSLEGGIAWYRKRFEIPADCDGKRIYIHFDGVYRDSTVYLNEYYIGRYESGYASFSYDITDFVNEDENLLAVRVNSTGREGWWYEGGGIYRHVWLEIKSDISSAHNGVFLCSDVNLKTKSAALYIQTEIENKRLTDSNVTVEQIVYDADNNEIARTESTIISPAWDNSFCKQSISLDNANLWDTENPYLYSLKTNIYADETLVDTKVTSFGIRDICFDADKGFFLNGENIKIKGLCCHQDHAGIGIAENDSVFEYRIAQMKSMGANAYRSAHHMMTDELLNICDRMGMLVFDETRRMSSSTQDLECLRTMVKHARNHPCVFLYGIGNEEIFSQHKPETARTTITMKSEIKKFDPSRKITSAVVCWNGKERFDNAAKYVDVTKHLDVMGFNYCKTAWDDYHKRMPNQPIIITEASSNSGTRGCYSTDESLGQYYILDTDNGKKCQNSQKAQRKNMGESEWKYFAERDYLAGIFLWTGMDYRGEPTPLAYPAISSQFGIFDYCGFPKDNYWYYKSWWTDEPILHIFPHWNMADKAGEMINVHCYSNLDEAELFVNDKSYGKQKIERNWYLTWENVVYEIGETVVKGYKDDKEVLTKTVRTTDVPFKIELLPYKDNISIGETAIINVRITDKNGMTVPTADNEITFSVEGGQFIGCGNGNPGDHASDKLPLRRAFNGLCQLLAKANNTDTIKITAQSNGLLCGVCDVKVTENVR
jgi:beta-galactosidase